MLLLLMELSYNTDRQTSDLVLWCEAEKVVIFLQHWLLFQHTVLPRVREMNPPFSVFSKQVLSKQGKNKLESNFFLSVVTMHSTDTASLP